MELEDFSCYLCGSKNAYFREDPYNSEIYDDYTLRPICDDCYKEALLDI